MPLEKDSRRVSLIAVDGVEERDRLVNTTRISTPIVQRARERVILTERQRFCGASKKSDSQRFSVPTCMTQNGKKSVCQGRDFNTCGQTESVNSSKTIDPTYIAKIQVLATSPGKYPNYGDRTRPSAVDSSLYCRTALHSLKLDDTDIEHRRSRGRRKNFLPLQTPSQRGHHCFWSTASTANAGVYQRPSLY